MKMVNRVGKIAMVGVFVFGGLVWAQPAPPENNQAPVEPPRAPVPELELPPTGLMSLPNLTDVQREQIQTLEIKHLKEVMPLETDLKIKRIELAMLWQVEKLDPKQIVAKVKEIGELRNRMELAKVNHQIEIYKILTPEQRKMFQSGFGMRKGMRRMGRRARAKLWQGRDGPGAMPCFPQR
ncbi:MAG: Spy/CpxP family protein refolding chaperone [bacterium]